MKKNSLLKIIILLSIILFSISILLVFNKNKEDENKSEIQTQVENEEVRIKERYECNELIYVTMSIDDLILLYFNDYKTYALTNPEQAYELLDKDYREKRFKNLEEYKTYISNNEEKINNDTLKNYQIEVDDEKTRYICIDLYGNYYIFCEKSVMDYSVLLDAYTIDQPEFIEKYDSANVQEKVVLNIEKIVQAHNMQDYSYIYSKLADSFKNNKYKTQAEFENYIKGALYNNIDVEYKNFSNEGETYIYDIEIKNRDNEEDKVINMQIIMQLKEDRDFVMSFSIK